MFSNHSRGDSKEDRIPRPEIIPLCLQLRKGRGRNLVIPGRLLTVVGELWSQRMGLDVSSSPLKGFSSRFLPQISLSDQWSNHWLSDLCLRSVAPNGISLPSPRSAQFRLLLLVSSDRKHLGDSCDGFLGLIRDYLTDSLRLFFCWLRR